MSNLYPFEERILEAEQLGIDVYETKFISDAKGFCVDKVININRNLSWVEKNCILAEEIGHAVRNHGNIIDQSKMSNYKEERRGRIYAYQKLVPLEKLIKVYKERCSDMHEVAESLDVTVDFLYDAIQYCYEYYGTSVDCGEYTIYFYDRGFSVRSRWRECTG